MCRTFAGNSIHHHHYHHIIIMSSEAESRSLKSFPLTNLKFCIYYSLGSVFEYQKSVQKDSRR